jgi:cyclase
MRKAHKIPTMSRRSLLVTAGAAAVLFSGSLLAAPETPTPRAGPAHFTLSTVGPGVYAAVARPGDRSSVGNAGFVVGTDAVLVVDSFATVEAARELLAEIRRITRAPLKWVVNTHYHFDHVGGDRVFTEAGAVVLAHENVRGWVRTENFKWRKEITPEDRAVLASLALPDVTYRDGLSLWLGDRAAEIVVKPGHTGGDSVVFVPDADVVFTGDLFWKDTLPNLIDADTREWTKTLDTFLEKHPASRFIPGHGEPGPALDVRFFRDYLVGLRTSVEKAIAEGKSGPELTAQVLALLRKRYAAWTWFDQFAEKNIEQTEQELRGTKKYAPKPP